MSETATAVDTRTVIGDSVATSEGNSWEEATAEPVAETEKVWRYSYKFKIVPETTKPMLDYVFASTEEDARALAYERCGIPAGEPLTISRISETTNKTWSLS